MIATFDDIRLEAARGVRNSLSSKSTEELQASYKAYISEYPGRDIKAPFDHSFRDVLMELIDDYAPVEDLEALVTLSIESCRIELVFLSLPVTLLADIFDMITVSKCQRMFEFVEKHVNVWKEDMFFSNCKNILLRMCNDLLRRTSKTQEMVFCGRILLFLAKFFPFSERSGLNIVSEFNLDNVTEYDAEEDASASNETADSDKHMVDYNLYCKFWSLQNFCRNPMQCYEKDLWKQFSICTTNVLNTFNGLKLEHKNTKKLPSDYFAKYLTSQNLLDLQLSDVNFRRFVLVQLLILFQYLTVRSKGTNELTTSQNQFIITSTETVHTLLRATPPDGDNFDNRITNILGRETFWIEWKNDGCPDLRKDVPLAANCGNSTSSRRHLGDIVREADEKNEYFMGNPELTNLWNLSPGNLDACRSKKRDFLPTVDSFFLDAADGNSSPSARNDVLHDSNFTWRALRLLSRRNPHFFAQENATFQNINDYLHFTFRQIVDEQKSVAAVPEVVGPPDNIEEDDEVVLLKPTDEAADAENEFQVQNILPFRVTVLTRNQFHKICSTLQTDWIPLAQKLGYNTNEINDIKAAKKGAFEQTTSLVNLWFDEDDDSTLENFLYILEGLNLMDAAEQVKIAMEQNKNLKTDTYQQ